jgi:hypothetical protein
MASVIDHSSDPRRGLVTKSANSDDRYPGRSHPSGRIACCDPWARRFSDDLLVVAQGLELHAVFERAMIDSLLEDICCSPVAQPNSAEWRQVYTLTVAILKQIQPPTILDGNSKVEMAFRRLVQFIRDNGDLNWTT